MSSQTRNGIIFREVQYFRQPWLWLFVLAAVGLSIYAVVQLLLLDEPLGENLAANVSVLAVAFTVGIGLPALIFFSHLVTEVRRDGVYYHYLPFNLRPKKISLEQIKGYQATTHNPIKEFGGWGIRLWSKGKADNERGNRGVQLELNNGARILIGSQRAEDLAKAIETALHGE